MKSRFFLCVPMVFFVHSIWAESVYPIDPQVYGTHKAFSPPPPITPQNVLTSGIENQFVNDDFIRPSVVNSINNAMSRRAYLSLGQYGKSSYLGALWRQREANYYVIGSVAAVNAEDYRDGAGNKVDFGYQRNGQALIVGLLPNLWSEHRVTLLRDDIAKDKQPEHAMDPVSTRRLIGKYDLRLGAPDDSKTMHFQLSSINLKRRANNFDLRNSPPKSPKVFMAVKRQKYLADAHFNYAFNSQNKSTLGIQYLWDSHDAKRFVKTPKGDLLNGYRFADIKTDLWRFYGAHQWRPNKQHELKLALNYDHQRAHLKGINRQMQVPKMPTPQALWQMYYGRQFGGDITQKGLSAKMRYTFSLNEQQKLYGELASLYRLPENTERFAVLAGPAGGGWGLNPWISPERENRLTLGALFKGAAWGDYQMTKEDNYRQSWQVKAEAFYANVDDFITLDRYRGPKAPLKGNIISRNVSAKLGGVDLSYSHNWSARFSTQVAAHYRYGQNQTDNRPLYQIAPLSMDIQADWRDYFDGGSYGVGSRLRLVHRQNRRDADKTKGLGMDLDAAAAGFSTLDLYGSVEWKNRWGVSFGVDNVLNHHYAEWLSGSHVEAVAPRLVYAPGRMFWLRLSANF